MEDYLIKKGNYKFSNILREGYILEENQPVILLKKTMANGNKKVVYADYTTDKISLKFGEMDGITLKEYMQNFTDGAYTYWSFDDRTYKTANFIVTKGKRIMLNSQNGERIGEFDIILEKSSEV